MFSNFQNYDSKQAQTLLNYPVRYNVDINRVTTKFVHDEVVIIDSQQESSQNTIQCKNETCAKTDYKGEL